ncbi:MAG: helix-turn-helix transcriptional regulator [Clostridia bacterium]|nr:helix-turn-helix transcriptional regulator [Clostridia bacterium]
MEERRFIINYYKNADSGIHIQKIKSSETALTPHSHEYFQIYYILQGTLAHITENGVSTLTKGDAFIIPPECVHSIKEQKDTLFYTFSFTKESLESACNALPLVTQFLQDLERKCNVHAKISIKNDNLFLVEELMRNMHREFEEKEIGYADALRTYATSLLIILARYHFENSQLTIPKSSNRARIISSMEFIDENFAKQLTLDDMARWTAMSKSEFCRQFLEFSGTTFQKYLHTARINHAATLIKKDYSISMVHTACGYNDFSTFYRNFKKIMGCSPMQYRKINYNSQR